MLFLQIRWIAASLALLFAGTHAAAEPEAVGSDPADADRERLRQIEQEVEILKRKLEVQEEDALQKASRTAIAGAGPDGFFLRSADGKFSIKLRGYTQLDSRWLTDGEDAGDDTFVFRRVRPFVEGTVFEFIDFRVMPDFANSTATLFDAYLNFRYLPQLQVQGGKFKPPVGLERLQSATATMFIERGFPTLLVPSRDLGGMVHGEPPMASSPISSAGSTAYATAARRTSTPTTARTSWAACSCTRSGRSAISGSTVSALVRPEAGAGSTSSRRRRFARLLLRRTTSPTAAPTRGPRRCSPRSQEKASGSAGRAGLLVCRSRRRARLCPCTSFRSSVLLHRPAHERRARPRAVRRGAAGRRHRPRGPAPRPLRRRP